ncbi:hypothetical protein BCR34DRAFT_39748 [Clohesyomyces aquaticus]|uniref:Uncharacterized protein n=1 Tax=Clohesyomyces aquaticus TaxID=1231657 RepID=A0A1Y2A619_9PLEO|nr:hypothetical protein BCR34DRAFT_39748 [Clohesyomyces aquaticus]
MMDDQSNKLAKTKDDDRQLELFSLSRIIPLKSGKTVARHPRTTLESTSVRNGMIEEPEPLPKLRASISANMRREVEKVHQLERLRDEISAVRRDINLELKTYSELQSRSFAEKFYTTLPRELRLIVYDHLLAPLRSTLGQWNDISLRRFGKKIDEISRCHINSVIVQEAWVGSDVAQEAARHWCSSTDFKLQYATDIDRLLSSHFYGGIRTRELIRKLEISIRYSRKGEAGGHRISALRKRQRENLEALLSITQTRGFRLIATITPPKVHERMTQKTFAYQFLKGIKVFEELAPTLYRLKDAGMVLRVMQGFGLGSDVEDRFYGWLDGSPEALHSRIVHTRDMLQTY